MEVLSDKRVSGPRESIPDQMMTAADVAKFLQVDVKTVYSLCKRVKRPLPSTRIGTTAMRFSRIDVYRWCLGVDVSWHASSVDA